MQSIGNTVPDRRPSPVSARMHLGGRRSFTSSHRRCGSRSAGLPFGHSEWDGIRGGTMKRSDEDLLHEAENQHAIVFLPGMGGGLAVETFPAGTLAPWIKWTGLLNSMLRPA